MFASTPGSSDVIGQRLGLDIYVFKISPVDKEGQILYDSTYMKYLE